MLQPKLTIGASNDEYEREADDVADKVMRMKNPFIQAKPLPISPVQRKCAHCEEEDKKLQRKEMNEEETGVDESLTKYVGGLSGSGQPLPNDLRNFYEPRFGYDFSNVKLHTDSVAAKSAQSINALAYTSHNSIVFNEGQYSPDTETGKRLLGHELMHVVQQGAFLQTKNIQRSWDWRGAGIGALTGAVGGAIIGGAVGGGAGALIGAGVGALAGGVAGGLIGGALSNKTVTINISVLQGATDNSARDIATSNSIFSRNGCGIRITRGVNSPLNPVQTTAVLGADNLLEEPSGDTASTEEHALTAINRTSNRLTAYYVPGFNPSKRGTSLQARSHGVPDSLLMAGSAAVDTFTHELCHILARSRGHFDSDPDNLMAGGDIRNVGVDKLTSTQCHDILSNTSYPQ